MLLFLLLWSACVQSQSIYYYCYICIILYLYSHVTVIYLYLYILLYYWYIFIHVLLLYIRYVKLWTAYKIKCLGHQKHNYCSRILAYAIGTYTQKFKKIKGPCTTTSKYRRIKIMHILAHIKKDQRANFHEYYLQYYIPRSYCSRSIMGKVSPPFTHTVLYYYYTQWYPIASSPAHALTAWDVSTARFELWTVCLHI